MIRLSVLVGVLSVAAGAAWAAKVEPMGYVEDRSVRLASNYSPLPSFGKVLVRVSGDDLKGATSVKVDVTEAKDDTGKDISKSTAMGVQNSKRLTEWDVNKQDGSFLFEFGVGSTARAAKKFSVKGEVTVNAGGEMKEAKVSPTLAPGAAADDETLKAAGLTLKRVKPTMPNDSAVAFEVTGSVEAIAKVKVLAKDGKEVNSNFNTHDNLQTKAKILTVFSFGTKPGDELTIIFTVPVGQKAVKIPFELKDVALP
jgi:hypothetical protein